MREFIHKHFRHFNSAELRRAAEGYVDHLKAGGKMMVTLGGAMSTARLGISLAEMIRRDKVHAICCTGANLEEDVYNLIGQSRYRQLPKYADLTPEDESGLLDEGFCRVTDVAFPIKVMYELEDAIRPFWVAADESGERYFPHEYLYDVLKSGVLTYDIDPSESWLLAAAEKNLPMFVPGWEDSTLGNGFVSYVIEDKISGYRLMKSGLEYMESLVQHYRMWTKDASMGFFQLGGGIAGDFPICVVPLIREDLKDRSIPLWSYFCQISDSITSLGSYSGARPNEKITWEKLGIETPRFMIESDATIVAPLIFGYVLET